MFTVNDSSTHGFRYFCILNTYNFQFFALLFFGLSLFFSQPLGEVFQTVNNIITVVLIEEELQYKDIGYKTSVKAIRIIQY